MINVPAQISFHHVFKLLIPFDLLPGNEINELVDCIPQPDLGLLTLIVLWFKYKVYDSAPELIMLCSVLIFITGRMKLLIIPDKILS